MAAYKDLVGQKITKVTSNPGEPKTGQMWYNSTDGNLKALGILEAISSASPLVYTNFSGGTFGAQTAAVIAGGYSPPTNPPSHGTPYNHSQEYNGTNWSVGGDLNTARTNLFGFGVETAGVVASGFLTTNLNAVEEYNGTAFTSVNNIGTARRGMEGAGPQTAGMVCGGYVGPAGTKATEEYDGTNWTAGGDLTTSNPVNYYNAITGTQTAGLRLGGQDTNASEEYDGSSWTSGNTMGSPRAYGGSFGAQTAALIAGGSNPPTTYLTAVEKYDGTSFSVSPTTLSSPRALTGQAAGGISGNTAGIFGGGYSPTDSPSGDYGNTKAEEYNVSTNAVTAAAWASSNNLNTARAYFYGCGLQDAALVVAGYNGSVVNDVEEYNGTSWSEQNNMGTSRYNNGTLGIQTAAFAVGGRTPPPDAGTTTVENYDGSSWTSAPSLNSARTYLAGVGTTSASLVAMGANPRNVASNLVEEYDGSSWSAQNTNSTTRRIVGAGGVQTSAVYFGGDLYPNPNRDTTETEEYDGTNWTTGGSLNIGRRFNAGSTNSPDQTAVLAFGGQIPSNTATTEGYDGTSWSTRPSMGTARHALAGAGIQTAALAAGGSTPSYTGATEEFTGETIAGNVTNFTTS